MPKRDGIMKTYSFTKETIDKLNALCESERRTQTNCIERLIELEYDRIAKKKEEQDAKPGESNTTGA